ncbi:uncharacterized protein LOC110901914 [Helianthus annuus]|uniref:uncharacterized protein LOC110901914 n=1 Tax=Helianthus annuus TaxID=4232 RepID=UPI0016533A79|nr:uncharacterized protein LOC110901914 [Helianthus annuus]
MESKLHPAMTISNIKNFIPITLEIKTDHYTTRAELFQVHCRAYQVFDHLEPPSPSVAAAAASTADGKSPAPVVDPSWSRLDAIVQQWIYGTISTDLLHTIISTGQSTYEAWTAVENQFKDNKNTRAFYIQQEFANVCLENYPNMVAYCMEVKLLSGQLTSFGSPVDNNRLVLHLLAGLTDQYDGISTILQNRDPLPDFSEVRSRLTMEEKKRTHQATTAAKASATALHTAATTLTDSPSNSSSSSGRARLSNSYNNSRGRSRGWGRQSGGRGGRSSSQQPYPFSCWGQFPWMPQFNSSTFPWPPSMAQPPCPYPSAPRTTNNNSAGILGPRPNQVYTTGYSPTDIAQALYTLSLSHTTPSWIRMLPVTWAMKMVRLLRLILILALKT